MHASVTLSPAIKPAITTLLPFSQVGEALGYHGLGLGALTKQVLGFEPPKERKVTMSNWEARALSAKQVRGAAAAAAARALCHSSLEPLELPTPLPPLWMLCHAVRRPPSYLSTTCVLPTSCLAPAPAACPLSSGIRTGGANPTPLPKLQTTRGVNRRFSRLP